MRKKLSGICHRLMQRNWSSSTSFKRGNIGTIVELYIEHSFVPIPSDDSLATKMDATRLGRIATLTNVINDILPQLSNTIACKGPVDAYPTCNYQSFGSFYAVALSFLPKELDFFFDSSFGDHAKSPESAIKLLDVVAHLIDLLHLAPPYATFCFIVNSFPHSRMRTIEFPSGIPNLDIVKQGKV